MLKGEKEFFMNANGRALGKENSSEKELVTNLILPAGPLSNRTGSILWCFQEVTKISRASNTTARRVATGLFHSHSYLKTQVTFSHTPRHYKSLSQENRLQHHTFETAQEHYDRDLEGKRQLQARGRIRGQQRV